jgi:hypothetical protein
MNSRTNAARWLTGLGCLVLLASAILHCLAYVKIASPGVAASNLPAPLKSVFTVAFLSMAWSWLVLAIIAWLAAFRESTLRKPVVLLCGFAVLLQTIYTLLLVGFFIGNEMIGAASLLLIAGGFAFAPAPSRVEVPAD